MEKKYIYDPLKFVFYYFVLMYPRWPVREYKFTTTIQSNVQHAASYFVVYVGFVF